MKKYMIIDKDNKKRSTRNMTVPILFHLDESSLYEHIFERYVQLENGIDELKQDLGIQNRHDNQIEINIEPWENMLKKEGTQTNRKTGRVLRKRRNHKNNEITDTCIIENTFNLAIDQSITSLSSSKDNNNSTTGYVLWSITPFFIKWLLYSPSGEVFRSGIKDIPIIYSKDDEQKIDNDVTAMNIPSLLNTKNQSGGKVSVVELGSGISGILPITLGNYVDKYIATDQRGILNKLKENITGNMSQLPLRSVKSVTLGIDDTPKSDNSNDDELVVTARRIKPRLSLEVQSIDWETFKLNQTTQSTLYPYLEEIKHEGAGTVYVLAMDVIYNDFLIKPFLETIKQIQAYYTDSQQTVVCLVGIHLRSQDVVTSFLEQAVIEEELNVFSVDTPEWEHSRFNLYMIK